MTKKERSMVISYQHACMNGYKSVMEAYRNPSSAKVKAEEDILAAKISDGGYDYYVCGHNSNVFSCAYKYRRDGKEYLAYFTYASRYDIELN